MKFFNSKMWTGASLELRTKVLCLMEDLGLQEEHAIVGNEKVIFSKYGKDICECRSMGELEEALRLRKVFCI